MPILRFFAKYGSLLNIKHLILILLVFIIGRDFYKEFTGQKLRINPQAIKVTNRQTQKDLRQIAEKENQVIKEYETYIYKSDSVMLVLDSIQHRKRSDLRELQSWFDKY